MNEEYKRENHKSYLVLKQIEMQEEADYSIKMLCENPVEGILPMSIHAFNGEKELYYDISSKQPLSILYEKKEMHREDLEKLFGDMRKILRKLDEYLLDMEYLVVEPEYIYVHLASERSYFLYAPNHNKEFEDKVYNFAEYILGKICNEDERAVVYAYGFYRYVKEEKGDLAAALEKLLEDSSSEKASVDRADMNIEHYTESEGNFSDFYFDDETDCTDGRNEGMEGCKNEKEASGKERKSSYRVMQTSFFSVLGLGGLAIATYSVWKYGLEWSTLFSKGESIIGAGICAISLGGMLLFHIMDIIAKRDRETEGNVTVDQIKKDQGLQNRNFRDNDFEKYEVREEDLLVEGEDSFHHIEETNNYATVLLQENCYKEQRILIGRIRGREKQIDLSSFPFVIGKSKEQVDYILDDSSVSRIHARFTLRDDVVYLTDLNSTNGTMRNGIRLEPNELVMLEAEDEITIGRLTFTYH